MNISAWLASVVLLVASGAAAEEETPGLIPAAPLVAKDSLRIEEGASEDARECLRGLAWTAREFEVRCEAGSGDRGDALVRFSSPIAGLGEERDPDGGESVASPNDTVVLEWYAVRDEQGRPLKAPAVVVVHESGSGMTVGRIIARTLPQHRVHAFLIHLPYYGERRGERKRPDASMIAAVVRQAVADVRRARDAVAALPCVDASHIAVQGTSLGGFVAAIAGSLDDGFDSVHLLLAGGDLYDVIANGQKDAATFREELERAGFSGEKLRELVHAIEPTRVAHRLQPSQTWLYSARYDTVVPPRNAALLAKSARLEESHHIQLAANHYSGIVYLPFVLQRIVQSMAECGAIVPGEG
jgi:dienelactone hydrolase